MHTLVICRKTGYTIEHLHRDNAMSRFYESMDDDKCTLSAIYDAEGVQINAYHDPAQFPK